MESVFEFRWTSVKTEVVLPCIFSKQKMVLQNTGKEVHRETKDFPILYISLQVQKVALVHTIDRILNHFIIIHSHGMINCQSKQMSIRFKNVFYAQLALPLQFCDEKKQFHIENHYMMWKKRQKQSTSKNASKLNFDIWKKVFFY